jgi:TonB family protein
MRWQRPIGAIAFVVFAAVCARAQTSGATSTPPASSSQRVTSPAQESSPQTPAEKPLRIRVDGKVAAAVLTHQVLPAYPPIAEQAKISGTVVLHCVIGKDGLVQQLEYISGPPLLMKSAMDAVRQWSYEPTLLNGKAVEVDTTVSVVYTLGEEKAVSTGDQTKATTSPSETLGPHLKSDSQESTKTRDTSQEPYVYETVRGIMRYENDGTGTLETRARVKVQSSLGVDKLGQLIFNYNSANERLDIPYVRVIKPDGKIIISGPDTVQDLSAPVAMQAPMYSDARQKHVTVSGLAAGDILEYSSVNTMMKPLTPGQFWQSWKFINDAPSLDEEVELNVPSSREIKIKSPPDVTPTSRIVGDRKIYRWKTTTEHAAAAPLPPIPNFKRFDAASLLKGAQAAPSRHISFSSFESWKQIGDWYSSLERDRREPSADVKEQAGEITKDAKTDVAKVKALYEFVTRNIRYVSLSFGVGRYQPHSAGEVLTNRYGDCKDKATLLDALLEAEGIHSATVLINSASEIDPDVPTPSQFDHAITFVTVGGKEIWLDSTAQVAPFEYLFPQLRGKKALVVFPHATAELKMTPDKLAFAKYYMLEVNGEISEKKLALQLALEMRGDVEVLVRTAMIAMPSAQLARLMTQGAKQADPKTDFEISEFKTSDPFDTTKPYRVELRFSMTMPEKKSSEKSSNPEFSAPDVQEILSTVLPEAAASKEALQLSGPEQLVFKVKLDLPAKASTASFRPAHVVKDFAEFSASGSTNLQKLSAELDLNIHAAEIPADQIAQYTEFRNQVLDGLQHLVHVVKADEGSTAEKSAGPAAGSSSPTDEEQARQLYDSGMKEFIAGNYRGAAELLEKSTARDPHNSAAFNALGRLYVNMGQYPKAAASFRKAIEINPQEPHIYNNLGFALMDQGKYEEAIPLYQKQLEITPDDSYVHPNLGRLYIQIKDYDKAAAEFELAAKESPDNAQAAISLGDAYAKARQPEKAAKALDRALELSSAPSVQNGVAYEFALMNVQMERAELLVKSAIATVSAQTIAVDLDNLSKTDIRRICEIAAYWDTLGWIKFREDDLTSAEKYIGAAWGLCEYSEIGDHLAQIYEQEGRTTDAIVQYELTLGKSAPMPGTRPRLTALVPPGTDIEAAVVAAKEKRASEAGIRFKNTRDADGNGELWLVFSPGPTVDASKLISGSDELQETAGDIRALKFPDTFPDSTGMKLLRRAWVTCSKYTHECRIGLIPADSVTALN